MVLKWQQLFFYLDDTFIFPIIAITKQRNLIKETMASVRELKKFVNKMVDEINYDIELYVGLNLDKNHFEAQAIYEEVYELKVKYLEMLNVKDMDKEKYRKLTDEFLKEIDLLNQKLCKLIGNS